MVLPAILHRVEAAGHVVFTDGVYNVNLVFIRSNERKAGRFDDLCTLTYREPDGAWQSHGWPSTTDPGIYWLEHPMHVQGTAIVVPGQYRGALQIGTHGASGPAPYKCLVQRRPIAVWRDGNKDELLDWGYGKGIEGWYSLQVHRASPSAPPNDVHKWSAGCLVLQHPDHFAEFMAIIHKAFSYWGNVFTLTLLTEDQL